MCKEIEVRTGAWDQGEEGLKDQTRGGLLENWELEALKCGPSINTQVTGQEECRWQRFGK